MTINELLDKVNWRTMHILGNNNDVIRCEDIGVRRCPIAQALGGPSVYALYTAVDAGMSVADATLVIRAADNRVRNRPAVVALRTDMLQRMSAVQP